MPEKRLVLTHDVWLSRLLERQTFSLRFDGPETAAPAADDKEWGGILDEKQRLGPIFAYAKADARKLGQVHILEDVGFHLIDTAVSMECRQPAYSAGTGRARPAVPADAPAVTALAGRCFRFSRFHQDQRLCALADQIKAAWAANYFSGARGDMMVVAEDGGKVIGFLQILLPQDGGLVIDLIGVEANFQGRGAGRAMIETACRLTGRNRLKVGTQLVNTGALAFYQRLGFSVVSAAYVFHYHG